MLSKTTLIVAVLLCIVCASCDTSVPNTPGGASQSTTSSDSADSTPAWIVSRSVDKMTNVKSWYAISPSVNSVDPMRFPYTDTRARMAVACDKKSKWAYVTFSGSINLTGTVTHDGFDTVATRIRWDSNIEHVKFTEKWGARHVQFESTDKVITDVISHKTALLELQWFEQGTVYFRFPLEGAKAAVQTALSKCAQSAAAAVKD